MTAATASPATTAPAWIRSSATFLPTATTGSLSFRVKKALSAANVWPASTRSVPNWASASLSNTSAKANEIVLQPARGVAETAMSVRSPVLAGLGRLSFSYRAPDGHAEVWLQVATNAVIDNLSGPTGYNETTNAVELGASSEVGQWITIRKFTYDDLKDGQPKAVGSPR